MNYERRYIQYKRRIERYLRGIARQPEPDSLFIPARYVLAAGGKRIRPMLVLLSCAAVRGRAQDALHAAAAVEILHNFTLVHDDIMDNADTRRGKPTVHRKWDTNVAILVGDAMLGFAYRALLRSPNGNALRVASLLTKAYIDVCIGQALDKEFETRVIVSTDEYLEMIALKTGRLISAAMEIGATIGGATRAEFRALQSFGNHLGRAFQIQDDLLDVVADERAFGKTIGGDIVEGKKTFLLLHALEHATGTARQLLLRIARKKNVRKELVENVREVYMQTGAVEAAHRFIARDTNAARTALRKLGNSTSRSMLLWMTDMLERRLF